MGFSDIFKDMDSKHDGILGLQLKLLLYGHFRMV